MPSISSGESSSIGSFTPDEASASLSDCLKSLVARKSAKLQFLSSSECSQCLEALATPALAPEIYGRALGILSLAAREPTVAQALSARVNISSLDRLLPLQRTAVMRLVSCLGLDPTPAMVASLESVLKKQNPLTDDIVCAQFAPEILGDTHLDLTLDPTAPPLFLAAQIAVMDAPKINMCILEKAVRSRHRQLRLTAAQKLAAMGTPDLLPFVADLLPDPQACQIAADVVKSNPSAALVLCDTGILAKLLKDPSPQALELCAATAQSDDLRDELMRGGAITTVVSNLDVANLQFLRVLTGSVRALRSGAAGSRVAEYVLQGLQSDDISIRSTSMAAACNLVLDISPIAEELLEGGALDAAYAGVDSDNRDLRLNSVLLLKHAAYAKKSSEFKAKLLGSIGVAKLLHLCDCGDSEIERVSLGLLRNYLCNNTNGIDMWLTEASVDLWDLLERKISEDSTLNTTLYVLVHIAGGTKQHQEAILERPRLMRRLVTILDGTSNDETLLAGVWLLTNLYFGRTPESLGMFRSFLERCKEHNIAVRSRAEYLLNFM